LSHNHTGLSDHQTSWSNTGFDTAQQSPSAGGAQLGPEAAQFETVTGMNSKAAVRVSQALGRVLADSFQMFIKTQGVHWNVAGGSFFGIHKLTEAQYLDLFEAIDVVAERIRALGQKAPASYTTYGTLSRIKDEDEPQTAGDMIAMLVRDNGLVCKSLREGIDEAEKAKDVVTADLLTARLSKHEQNAWMLQMHIAEER
jgi:starvation-inducible DNA-binding protein